MGFNACRCHGSPTSGWSLRGNHWRYKSIEMYYAHVLVPELTQCFLTMMILPDDMLMLFYYLCFKFHLERHYTANFNERLLNIFGVEKMYTSCSSQVIFFSSIQTKYFFTSQVSTGWFQLTASRDTHSLPFKQHSTYRQDGACITWSDATCNSAISSDVLCFFFLFNNFFFHLSLHVMHTSSLPSSTVPINETERE